ncbi:MAG: dockerin type I domain-containing protein [Bacillota bacterium]|nr:dockerin type I domain-containing protein [Bacillota bacterium]
MSAGNNAINMSDIMEASKVFNSIEGDGQYNAEYDFNKDGAINIVDFMIIAKHFNEVSY